MVRGTEPWTALLALLSWYYTLYFGCQGATRCGTLNPERKLELFHIQRDIKRSVQGPITCKNSPQNMIGKVKLIFNIIYAITPHWYISLIFKEWGSENHLKKSYEEKTKINRLIRLFINTVDIRKISRFGTVMFGTWTGQKWNFNSPSYYISKSK